MNDYYPVFLSLKRRTCLVIGGGPVAERKVQSLLSSSAKIVVVAPELTPALKRLASEESVVWLQRHYARGDLSGAFLVIAATDDQSANEMIKAEADERGILINVVDNTLLCNFIVPSVIQRGDLTVAFSTGGKSPALAKRVRQIIEETIGPEYGEFLELLGDLRDDVKRRYADQERRALFWQGLVDSDILDLLREGKMDLVSDRIDDLFRQEEA